MGDEVLLSCTLLSMGLNAVLVHAIAAYSFGPSLGTLKLVGAQHYGDIKRRRRVWYLCMSALVVSAAIVWGWYSQSLSPNLYSVLGISRQSSVLEIRNAYKQRSKEYHPDKNPGKDTESLFLAISEAYKVLMSESDRSVYNKFGLLAGSFDPRLDEIKLFSSVIYQYLVWLVYAFILTIRVPTQSSRVWIAVVGIVMLMVHALLLFTEDPLPSIPLFQYFTEYELLSMMQLFFPSIMAAICFLAEYYYVDVDIVTILTMREIAGGYRIMQNTVQQLQALASGSNSEQVSVTNKQSTDGVILENNSYIEGSCNSSKDNSSSSSSSSNSSSDDSEAESIRCTESNSASNHSIDVDRTKAVIAELQHLREQLENSSSLTESLADTLVKSSPSLGANYYWIIFILMFGGMLFMQ